MIRGVITLFLLAGTVAGSLPRSGCGGPGASRAATVVQGLDQPMDCGQASHLLACPAISCLGPPERPIGFAERPTSHPVAPASTGLVGHTPPPPEPPPPQA